MSLRDLLFPQLVLPPRQRHVDNESGTVGRHRREHPTTVKACYLIFISRTFTIGWSLSHLINIQENAFRYRKSTKLRHRYLINIHKMSLRHSSDNCVCVCVRLVILVSHYLSSTLLSPNLSKLRCSSEVSGSDAGVRQAYANCNLTRPKVFCASKPREKCRRIMKNTTVQ